jgi:hypothetical protein
MMSVVTVGQPLRSEAQMRNGQRRLMKILTVVRSNIWIRKGNKLKAAFRTNWVLFKPLGMYFGLTNSPATFQTMMNNIFQDLILSRDIMVYLDNILITHSDLTCHRKIVWEVLHQLQEHRLFLCPEKCEFEKSMIEYLGVIILYNHIEMHPVKVAGVTAWPVPENKKDVQQVLSFMNFYQRFIQVFSNIAWPLFNLTKKGGARTWTAASATAFQALKDAVTTEPVLVLLDKSRPYRLEVTVPTRHPDSFCRSRTQMESGTPSPSTPRA